MKIALLGQAPLPSAQNPFSTFPQLRTWSMYHWLQYHCEDNGYDLELFLLHDGSHSEGFNVYSPEDMKRLYTAVESKNAIVTAGPFLPLIALLHIPNDIPVWLDYPSDPLADRDCKNRKAHIPPDEYSFITELTQHALHRADHIGVISQRQYWALLGQRLLLDTQDISIDVMPIAFDFPHHKIEHKTSGHAVLLAGSNNAWLDLDRLSTLLQNQTVHCTGMTVPKLHEQLLAPEWISHGWLTEEQLERIIEECAFGVWTDTTGIEPLLGSRTRALFYIWMGLTPIGDVQTELSATLKQHDCMRTWNDPNPFQAIDIAMAQKFCEENYSPSKVYLPIAHWLKQPKLKHRLPKTTVHDENLRLRQTLQNIYSSRTWRWGSQIHQRLLKIKTIWNR